VNRTRSVILAAVLALGAAGTAVAAPALAATAASAVPAVHIQAAGNGDHVFYRA